VRRWLPLLRHGLAVLLVVAALGSQLVLRSPLIHLATRPHDSERIAAAHRLMERIPPDAALTVTSTLGSHMGGRREFYFFPGGGLIYASELVEQGDYLLADTHEVPPDYRTRFEQLRQSAAWRTLAEEHDFVLLKRATP
jgi:hypothetical protein